MRVELRGGNYRVVVDGAHGGSILSGEWQASNGETLAVLAPWNQELQPFKAGCFAMLPFVNRIADGRFRFAGHDHVLPINHPEENMAIHGFARDNPWALTTRQEGRVVMEQDFEQAGNPYCYRARQEISLSDEGIRIALSVRNEGHEAMPFGIGLHPWFPKTFCTTLTFASRGGFDRDARGLPTLPSRVEAVFDEAAPGALGALPWFDGCFERWSPRAARMVRPEDSIAIELEAEGALRHLHVFVPDDRSVLCAEPVSHAPDAINRPELGASNAMDVLAPGEVLSGTMTFLASAVPPP